MTAGLPRDPVINVWGTSADWQLLYRDLCQGSYGVVCRPEAACRTCKRPTCGMRSGHTLLLGMRSCLTGLALLFGVGAMAAHDGVRKAEWINLLGALAEWAGLLPVRSHATFVPVRTSFLPRQNR